MIDADGDGTWETVAASGISQLWGLCNKWRSYEWVVLRLRLHLTEYLFAGS